MKKKKEKGNKKDFRGGKGESGGRVKDWKQIYKYEKDFSS